MKDDPNRAAAPRRLLAIPGLVIALAIGALIAAAMRVQPAGDYIHDAETTRAMHVDAALRGGNFLPARP